MDLALFFSETQWRQIFLTWSYALTWWKYPIPHYICITAVLEHGFLQRKSFRCCHLLGLYVKEGLVPLHHMLLRSSCSVQDSPHSTSGSAAPGSKGMVRQALKNKLELSTQKRQIHNHHWDGVHRLIRSNRLKKDNIFLSVVQTQKNNNKKHQWQNRLKKTYLSDYYLSKRKKWGDLVHHEQGLWWLYDGWNQHCL